MDLPSLLTTWGDRGPSLVAVVYYHAIYLFVYNVWWCLRAVNNFFTLGVKVWFSLFIPESYWIMLTSPTFQNYL